ncbi:MAG TPA: alpha/beta hydrolase [Tepidisphaeraceae bacterium]
MHATHLLFIALYLAAPPIAFILAFVGAGPNHLRHISRLFFTMFVGTLLGTAGTVAYAVAIGARAGVGQIFASIYFATAMLLILRGFDFLLRTLMRKLLPARQQKLSFITINSIRIAALIVIGLPYVISAVAVYRPAVTPRDSDPLGVSTIEFASTDGIPLSGRWIPAIARNNATTILLCHGFGSGSLSELSLARRLMRGGYNAFAFDFRAAGRSGGHFTSFGDLERRDVLAAVRWLHQFHPRQSRRIVGVGVGTGAAALIAAAADPAAEGQSIQAIAVYDTYDDLKLLSRDLAHDALLPPMNWLAPRISLPLASLQVGVNLDNFKPAQLVRDLWPRPILVIHGMRDALIPFECGERLFDAAYFPKEHLWLPGDDYNDVTSDDNAAAAVREFFATAKSMPVI